jgi:hypothetical protein
MLTRVLRVSCHSSLQNRVLWSLAAEGGLKICGWFVERY